MLKELIQYLNENKLVLSTAESCTAGDIMASLSKEGNCGECLFIGYVVYHAQAKQKELGVNHLTIKKYGLTSEEVAREMTIGTFQHEETNTAIATTGIIGDEAMDGIPPGTVCFAWGFRLEKQLYVFSETQKFQGDTKDMSKKAALYALSRLKEYHQHFNNRKRDHLNNLFIYSVK
ncbi:MAG TPA: nicotinamide-nucleotide amidohydrolase family protein [Legionella sp.]|nr:nicotinamide-nucleotide amidohydrolase family protein [Legionella sp.]